MMRILPVLSAGAFLCLHIHRSAAAVSVAAAIPFLVFFAIRRPELAKPRAMNPWGKALCALTAMGACLWPAGGFAGWLRSITVFQKVQGFLGSDSALLSQIAVYVFAAAGLLFAYRMVGLFYERFLSIAGGIVRDFTREEGMLALAVSVLVIAVAVLVYTRTDAFASPVVTRDLIYTADSGAIVHENAYLSLTAIENDVRSPLFAVFAAPLTGLPYLLGRVLPFPNAGAAVLVAAQAPLLVISAFLLMKLIRDVSRAARPLLPVLLLSTYGSLLFTLTAEQYVIALFYMSLCLYALLEQGRREPVLILGAAGTMLPGAALAFLKECKEKKASAVLKDALKTALWGLVLLLTFGGLGVLLRIPDTFVSVSRFTGAGIAFPDRIPQYLSFVGQCFAAPQAGGFPAADGYAKWRLSEPGNVSILGIVLLTLSLLGFLINRKRAVARISMLWIGVSFLLLCVLGWGTAEYGLTLYTLYFGWAFLALLICLVESICKALKLERFSWVAYALGAAAMLAYNLPKMAELVRFAVSQYPL